MAKSVLPATWENGFKEPGKGAPWVVETSVPESLEDEEPHYTTPPSADILTSGVHNELGLNVLRTWPTIYDGTNTPHGLPDWWKPSSKVDVLICGAGPSGLQVALSLVRQGVSFRIIDKAPTPLIAGRADGVQPRFLETLHSWGLSNEVHEEGPIIERTAIYKDGKKLLFTRSHQSDSRYRGLHIITQGQIERIYIRDLLRHHQLVERQTVITDFESKSEDPSKSHPIQANLRNEKTGDEESVSAKFLVASDGAASLIRKKLDIPFDGVSTEIYWGIMDCVFETDYPHAWIFGSVISSKHGGCVIIPREDGYIRLYTQLDTSKTGDLAKGRQASSKSFQESGGRVDINGVTAEEVLEQANKIFAPYTLKFAAPLSWFAVWKISERVARSFSSKDNRVHLVGDAAHVHSVMGAFGLNASIMDSANLAWKIGLCALNLAKLSTLGPTYDTERRVHAHRIIRVSGSYLRFVCKSDIPLADFAKVSGLPDLPGAVKYTPGEDLAFLGNTDFPLADFAKVSGLPDLPGAVEYTPGEDLAFLGEFFKTNGQFLLGVDAPYIPTAISPEPKGGSQAAISPKNGVRAPNPRLCFSVANTGYLYDALTGASIIHLVIFASDIQGPVRKALSSFSATLSDPNSFFHTYGSSTRFNLVLVTTSMPIEAAAALEGPELKEVRDRAKVLSDDRAPDESAHTCYEVDHARGAVMVIRPDLWVGTSVFLDEAREGLGGYFGEWLIPVSGG